VPDEQRQEFWRRYAEVAVRVGANLQPGQSLRVVAGVEHVPLARALMEAGWRAGAGNVEVYYRDEYERYLLAAHGADDVLGRTSGAYRGILEASLEAKGASISVIGDEAPRFFEDADPERLARTVAREGRALAMQLMNEKLDAWCVIAYPDPGWATRVFGEPDVDRLIDEIAAATRLDSDDPIAEWEEHLDRLARRARLLDERRFDRLHFRGPGTDLTVGLLERSRFVGGNAVTAWGQVHCPNLPTEEVFTTPDRNRVEGTVRATRPVAYQEGALVEGIELRFEAGAVVEAKASRGEEFLRSHLRSDDGSSRLGEVALVAGSPVGARGIVYFNTLFDENATSHLAYGMGYVSAVEGATDLSHEEQLALGINQSRVHVDFPVGGDGVEVEGIDPRGERVPILAGEEWLLA
jgi:aminopeptidase